MTRQLAQLLIRSSIIFPLIACVPDRSPPAATGGGGAGVQDAGATAKDGGGTGGVGARPGGSGGLGGAGEAPRDANSPSPDADLDDPGTVGGPNDEDPDAAAPLDDAGAGPLAQDGGSTPTRVDGGVTMPDNARYNFEVDTQGWVDLRKKTGVTPAVLTRVTSRAYRGKASLQVKLTTTATDNARLVGVGGLGSSIPGGTPITFHVFFTTAVPIASVQPYVLWRVKSTDEAQWAGTYKAADALKAGSWNTIVTQVPAQANEVVELGVEFKTSKAYTGNVFIDSVTW